MLWELFDQGRRLNPEGTALQFNDAAVSYQALERTTASVARQLPGARRIAAVFAEKVPAAYAALLAASRVDASVVPISPAAPRARQASMVRTVQAGIVIGPVSWLQGLAGGDAQALHVLDGFPDWGVWARAEEGTPHPLLAGLSSDPGYVVFTSGSTGTPKGVPIHGAALRAYVQNILPVLGIDRRTRHSHTFDLSFDAGLHDIAAPWASGGAACVPSGREALLVADYVARARLTHWFSVPSLVDIGARLGTIRDGSLDALRVSAFGGEALLKDQCATWKQAGAGEIVHLYGPSEMTIACTSYLVRDDDLSAADRPIPIGQPLPEVEVHLAPTADDEQLFELCLRGPQRFAGYLAEGGAIDTGAFLDEAGVETVDEVTESSYYRSGDLITVDERGDLTFHGRVDHQVKVGGYRVELSEIEVTARRLPQVAAAVAVKLSVEPGVGVLGLAYTSSGITDQELSNYLATTLPRYMVPRRFLHLDEMPLGPTGKVDRIRIAAAFAADA